MAKSDLLNLILHDDEIKLTALRKDILDIFLVAKKPLTAYEVLAKLKKKRPNAEPPTVYRVIDYFVQKKLIHRIETGNKYVCCSHLDHFKSKYHGILFLCQACHLSYELMDQEFLRFIMNFSKKNHLAVSESVVEIKGTCSDCLKTKQTA
jgi:Fur family zinc uptake transcriptional regulator